MKLAHFYHIYADGRWVQPFAEHVNALQQSGLLDALGGTFDIGIVGSEHSYQQVLDYVSATSAPVRVATFETEGYEQVTLDAVHAFSESVDEAYILYAHTKGAANQQSDWWRITMTHCNVGYWRSCVEALDDGCHLVGCHWIKNNEDEWFFAGNFFWGKASALRLLPKCERWSRYLAESWVNKLRPVIPNLTVKDVYAVHPYGSLVDTESTVPYLEKTWVASIDG